MSLLLLTGLLVNSVHAAGSCALEACRDVTRVTSADPVRADSCCAPKDADDDGQTEKQSTTKNDCRKCSCCNVLPTSSILPAPVTAIRSAVLSRSVVAYTERQGPAVPTIPDVPPPKA